MIQIEQNIVIYNPNLTGQSQTSWLFTSVAMDLKVMGATLMQV